MGNQKLPFDAQDVRRVLGSPEGQKILKLLNQDGGKALRQAADALRSGKPEDAMKALSPIMDTDEAAALIDKINKR